MANGSQWLDLKESISHPTCLFALPRTGKDTILNDLWRDKGVAKLAKKEKPKYYELGYDNSGFRSGASIMVGSNLVYRGERADFKPFLAVPIKELEKQLKDSEAAEKKIFEEMKKAIHTWDEHGAKSLLLQKAIEYLKVPEVKHTSNQWKEQKDGTWEISNLTYKMTFSIVKDGQEWKLSWALSYTAPGLQHGYWGYSRFPKERIDHESGKKYKSLAGAQKYIQSKFDQFSSFFESLSPPVPVEAKDFFCVNGQLLQGYTMERPKAPAKEVSVADLLDCLENEASPQQEEKSTTPPPPASPAPQPLPAPPQLKVLPGKATPRKSSPKKVHARTGR